jgi:predicted Zn-dependent peptidase
MSLLTRTLDDGPTTRLQRVIREELALVYHIGADYSGYWDAGEFAIVTSVRADRFRALVGHLLGLLADFRAHGPTAEEVARARQRALFDLEFGMDSLSNRIDRYAWPLLYSTVRDERAERELLLGITPERLQALAARLLDPRSLHLALVGPLDASLEGWLAQTLARFGSAP